MFIEQGGTDHLLKHTVSKQTWRSESEKSAVMAHNKSICVMKMRPAVLIKQNISCYTLIRFFQCVTNDAWLMISMCVTSWLVFEFSSVSLAEDSAGSTGRLCVAPSFCETVWPFLFCVFFGAPAPSPFARFCRKLASCAGRTARGRRTHRSGPQSTTTLSAWWSSGVKGERELESRLIFSVEKWTKLSKHHS